MLLSEGQRIFCRSQIRTGAIQEFYGWDLEQAFQRGKAGQAREYRGDFAPGEPVGVFYKFEGKNARARFVRGHVVAESPPERPGQTVIDRVWVSVNGRMLNIAKEELRDATGSEMWAPSGEDMVDIRQAESLLRKTRKHKQK